LAKSLVDVCGVAEGAKNAAPRASARAFGVRIIRIFSKVSKNHFSPPQKTLYSIVEFLGLLVDEFLGYAVPFFLRGWRSLGGFWFGFLF
jgi:hypothetical protein